jgi:hypothetical protein
MIAQHGQHHAGSGQQHVEGDGDEHRMAGMEEEDGKRNRYDHAEQQRRRPHLRQAAIAADDRYGDEEFDMALQIRPAVRKQG